MVAALVAPTAARASIVGAFGPYSYPQSHVPIVGSCGNVWAYATFTRTYTVVPNIYETVDPAGTSFVTVAGSSPGACNTGTDNGHTVIAGIRGKVSGRVVYRICTGQLCPKGVFDPNATCSTTTCDVVDFIESFFGAGTHFFASKVYNGIFFRSHNSAALACANAANAAIWSSDIKDQTGAVIESGDIATSC